MNRVARILALVAFSRQSKIDHHDRILFYDADQQNNSDNGDNRQIRVGEHHGQERADPCRRQGGKNRNGMNVAFVEYAQHKVDGDECGRDQQRFAAERILVRLRGSREAGMDC